MTWAYALWTIAFAGMFITLGLLASIITAPKGSARDYIGRGDAHIREAIRQQEQWEAARNVTGRVN